MQLTQVKEHPQYFFISLYAFCIAIVVAFLCFYKTPEPINSTNLQTITQVDVTSSEYSDYPVIHHIAQSAWSPIKLPSNADSFRKDKSHVFWYRAHFQSSATQLIAQSIFVPYVTDAAVVFVNKQEIASTAPTWPPRSTSWYAPKLWAVPEGVLHAGDNELLIAVYGHAGLTSGLPQIQIGNEAVLLGTYNNNYFLQQYLTLFTVIACLMSACLCLCFWLYKAKYRVTFWLIWVEVLTGLLLCNAQEMLMQNVYEVFGVVTVWKAIHLGSLLIGPCVYMTISRFYKQNHLNFERFMWSFCALATAWLVLFDANPSHWQIICQVSTCLFVIYAAFQAQRWGWTADTKPSDRLFAISCLFLGPFTLYDIAVCLHLTPFHFLIETIGANINTILISIILTGQLIANLLIARANRTELDVKANELSALLNDRRQRQHTIDLNNAKSQVRLQLWREIHDGVSHSLISAINQHARQVVPVNTTIDMLKKMRAELSRAMRNHFSDEQELALVLEPIQKNLNPQLQQMGITPIWQMQTPLQITAEIAHNLVLIVQEALVNVMKHSFANKVLCSFKVDNQTLVVEVIDSGLRANRSMEALDDIHSSGIGLVSMKERVQYLGGQWSWRKRDDGVSVKCQIPLRLTPAAPIGVLS